MKKKLLAILLTVCMVLSMAPAALAAEFGDTDGHWAEGSIERWADYGIIEGVGDGEFNPDGTMTRAQAAAIFARLLKLDAKADISKYTDVDSDAWYAEYIAMCVAAGIMNGVGDNAMDPNGTLTREQMMVMLCRALGIQPEATCDKTFADSDKISDWAEGYINALVNAGIVDGVGNNTMAPATDINRASMMALLDKSIAGYADEEGETITVDEDATGVVLVVADNVKVEDAPAGTIVVTGEDAHDTTVNGTEITNDTVHEVPEEEEPVTPSIPVHYCYVSTWGANGNGTHSGACICGASYTENCVLDSDKICTKCGAAYPTDADSLQAALNKGGYVKLNADVTATESLVIPEGVTVTLDLNGKSITGTVGRDADNNRVHTLVNNGTLTITGGGTVKSAGYDGGSAIYNYGTLTINNVTVLGAPQENTTYPDSTKKYPSYAINNYGIMTVDGAVVKSYHGAIATGGNGVTVVDDATVDVGQSTATGITSWALYTSGNGDLTVNGGKFENTKIEPYVNGGGYLCEDGSKPIVINGGSFSGGGLSTGEYTIKGGTFDRDPSAYVADTHKAVKDGEVWTVVERLPGEVINATEAQAALDNATKGTTIQLSKGVDYGTLVFRAVPGQNHTTLEDIADAWAYNYTRSIENITIIGAEGATVDAIKFETGALPGDQNNRVNIKNLVIDGVEFTDDLTASSAGYNAPIMITTSNATVDGLTVKNCKLIGDNSKLNLVYLYGADGSKNVTLSSNTVDGIARLCELRGTENVTITGNTIKNTYEHGMLLAGSGYSGNITITGNIITNTGDRALRFGTMPNTATVTISGNTITDGADADGQVMKFDSVGKTKVTLTGNTWNGCADAALIYNNGVWMLPVVMTADTSAFVAAMKKVPAGVAEITLVDTEGNTGMKIAPAGENSTLKVYSKEGLLYLNTLLDNWVACFTNGSGGEYSNYAPVNGGKGVDYYYGGRWTVSLEADIDLNNATIDPVTITFPTSTGAITLDGNNHTIKNAKIVTDATAENEAGLFNLVYNTAMNNLKLDNIHVTGSNVGNSTAGVLAGCCNAGVDNITITNSSVTGGKYTGGVVGYGYTDVTNCTLTNVTVKGGYKLGGLIGYICASNGNTGEVTGNTLTDCTVDGIGGGVYAGGKTEYVIGKVVGNYNCDGTCNNNTVTNMTTSATENIGKIEAGKTVTQ